MSRLFAGLPRRTRRAKYAVATLLLVASLALLFAFPAPKPYIEAQLELRGWNREGGVAVGASEERGLSLDWVSEDEALLTVVAPREALITVSSEQGAITFTIHELIMYGEREWMAAEGPLSAKILGGKVVDWDPTAGLR
jgi:hypothetical protein